MSTTVATRYKQLKKVKDDKFSIDKIEQYCLVLQVGMRDFQLAIVDTKTNRLLLLEDYILNETNDVDEKLEILKTLFDSHHLLHAGFWKEVILCFKSPKFSITPLALFSKEGARTYLGMNCKLEEDDAVGYYKIKTVDAVNIFTYDKPILKWVRSLYPQIALKVTHQSGMMINSVMENTIVTEDKFVSIFIDRFYLHIVVNKGDELLFFNSFKIQKFEDYARFINLTLYQFDIPKDSTQIKLWGHIKNQSAHFQALKKQFSGLSIGNRTTLLNFGFKFDEIPEHQYFDLFGNYFNL